MNKLKTFIWGLLLALVSVNASAAEYTDDRSDFRDETIYFVMTSRFYDGDPYNNVLTWDGYDNQIKYKDPSWRGDFKGLIERLEYIKALGFTSIMITPVVQNASGFDYHGYHPMDFSSVDLRYESHTDQGSVADVTFQSLIDAAHALDMKIILDVVLNSTSNFGESRFCPIFKRSPLIRNQSHIDTSIIPNIDILGADYFDILPGEQYNRRLQFLKNTDGINYDTHNYWHHTQTLSNDIPARWWGQMVGDRIDLNTENQAVSDYLLECYGKFIEMGVDAFRIENSGYIPRLTFNKSFIPQLHELGEKYKSKRLNECPFFIFGETISRFSEVTYRNQPRLSCYYYTWQSPQNLLDQWNTDASWWDTQELFDDNSIAGNMNLCLQEPDEAQTSDNAFLKNGEWHEPDYSQASGFNAVDSPMLFNFTNAGLVINTAKAGDKYYNDATYNVVYVDSYDYGPNGEAYRFNGGTWLWAENLTLMFTFRGIPCIFYGSEVEFQKGTILMPDPNVSLSQMGHAYFGAYLEGEVTATNFGEYTATGSIANTLNSDLAHHLRCLNRIRAEVPALRKGQYTFDGCTPADGCYAFKRAYKDNYALVAINGGATFTDVPNGTYGDVVTGESYNVTNGTVTVSAPNRKGQLRVLVKDWAKGKIAEDGMFIYTTAPVKHGDNPSPVDEGASFWYGPDDAIPNPAVTLSHDGGTFSNTFTVTASLNESATSGWIEVDGGARQTISAGTPLQFTIGGNTNVGDEVVVKWGAVGNNAIGDKAVEYTGKAVYKKIDAIDPFTIYIAGPSAPYVYAWYIDDNSNCVAINGLWPGTQLSNTKTVNGREFYCFTVNQAKSINFIVNNGNGTQTQEFTGITEDSYFEWDGSGTCTPITGSNTTNSEVNIYFDNTANWDQVYIFVYGSSSSDQIMGTWPGKPMTFDSTTGYYKYSFTTLLDYTRLNVIFNSGPNGSQTGDMKIRNNGVYNSSGDTGITGIANITNDANDNAPVYFDLLGRRVTNPQNGLYMRRQGNRVTKVYIP